MVITRSFLLIVAAVACFVIALIIALGASLGGSTYSEWVAGGLIAFAASFLPPGT